MQSSRFTINWQTIRYYICFQLWKTRDKLSSARISILWSELMFFFVFIQVSFLPAYTSPFQSNTHVFLAHFEIIKKYIYDNINISEQHNVTPYKVMILSLSWPITLSRSFETKIKQSLFKQILDVKNANQCHTFFSRRRNTELDADYCLYPLLVIFFVMNSKPPATRCVSHRQITKATTIGFLFVPVSLEENRI